MGLSQSSVWPLSFQTEWSCHGTTHTRWEDENVGGLTMEQWKCPAMKLRISSLNECVIERQLLDEWTFFEFFGETFFWLLTCAMIWYRFTLCVYLFKNVSWSLSLGLKQPQMLPLKAHTIPHTHTHTYHTHTHKGHWVMMPFMELDRLESIYRSVSYTQSVHVSVLLCEAGCECVSVHTCVHKASLSISYCMRQWKPCGDSVREAWCV